VYKPNISQMMHDSFIMHPIHNLHDLLERYEMMSTFEKPKLSFIFTKKEFTMLFVLIGMIIISAVISPTFRSVNNIVNLFNQNAIIGIMAIGMTFVLITGGFDMSVSSTVALTGVISTYLFIEYGFVYGVIGGLLLGTIVGAINGFLVAKAKISPFVTTLGTTSIVRGIVFIITSGFPVRGVPREYNIIGMGKIGPLPIAASLWLILAIIVYLLLKYTRFGQYLYAVGGNENAAWLSGVKTDTIKIIAFTICGFFASLAGIVTVTRVMIATADAATGYELTTIASCFVGGISVDGGKGNVFSSVIGTLIFGLILNMLQLLGISSFWQQAITGVVILAAVGFDSFSSSKRD
jgi:ribose/xylose/arabinose/galactoside ABC-type transport system permease subunit